MVSTTCPSTLLVACTFRCGSCIGKAKLAVTGPHFSYLRQSPLAPADWNSTIALIGAQRQASHQPKTVTNSPKHKQVGHCMGINRRPWNVRNASSTAKKQ